MKLQKLTIFENKDIQNSIIFKIRELINFKNLEPGDKLPSERMMSEKFGVSRSNIREAIQVLDFYRILKSVPQSGTFVANIGVIAMNGMIDEILMLNEPSFKSLVETRILLELKTAGLAASRRTEADLINMKDCMDAFTAKVKSGADSVQEDLLFHLAISKASGNSTITTLMLRITPEIITNFKKYHVCDDDQAFKSIKDHEEIYKAILDQKPKLAKSKMKKHFKALYQYCYNNENEKNVQKILHII